MSRLSCSLMLQKDSRTGDLSSSIDSFYHSGPVHKGTNHVPKAVSNRDPLPDWVCDLNYMCSHALQMPSQSRTGSAHECTMRSYFVPTAQIDPCMASARISKMHTHKSCSDRALRSHVLRIRLSRWFTIQNANFFAFQKLDLKQLCVHNLA